MTDKKEKKPRTPRTPESITAGALALSFAERVELCKKLKASINAELGDQEATAKQNKELANGL